MLLNKINKKKFLIIGLSTFLLSSCTNTSYKEDNINLFSDQSPITPTMTEIVETTKISEDTIVSINTKDGEIVLKLYGQETPNTVTTFINKANSGFYDNLTFHRVIPGFMAQGGDPTGTGTGGGSQKSELNNIPFKRGSVGLARTPASKEISNDSQFFICYTDEGCQHLTGDYVNFGEVISGLDVLDKINQGDKIIKVTSQAK